MAGRRQLRAARLPRLRPDQQGRRERAAHPQRLRPRSAAGDRRQQAVDVLRRPARPAQGPGASAQSADHHQVEYPLDGAPPGLPRPPQHQVLRCRRARHRRTPHHRPAHFHRLQHQPQAHPAAAPQGAERHRARRADAQEPCRQGAGHHPRTISARRTLPEHTGRALQHRHRHPASRRAPAHPPVRPLRCLRPLRLLPDLHPARKLQHRATQAHADGADGRLRRRLVGVRGALLRVGAGAGADHRAHQGLGHPDLRCARDRDPPHQRCPPLGRRPAKRADRTPRRRARHAPVPQLRHRLPRRLPRRLPGTHRGARHRPDGIARSAQRAGHEPLYSAGGAARPHQLQALPYRLAGAAVEQPAHARAYRRQGH